MAGGVNIVTGIHNYLDLGKAGFLSPTGQCKPFDAAADGYCRADGVELVFLKSLSQAVTDRDNVLGVIPGVATNHGGLSSSITVPYSRAQTALFKTVLNRAGIKANQVSYVEAYGTGTQVGDPIEIASVREVLGGPQRDSHLHIGSLKANIGHSETAVGVGSLLKVLAMIQHRQIPPLAGFQSLNPKILALEPDHLRIDLPSHSLGRPVPSRFSEQLWGRRQQLSALMLRSASENRRTKSRFGFRLSDFPQCSNSGGSQVIRGETGSVYSRGTEWKRIEHWEPGIYLARTSKTS